MTKRLLLPLLLLPALVAAPSMGFTQAPASPPANAKAWIGRADAMEAYLKTAEIVRVEDIGTGVTHPQRAFLQAGGPFTSLTWKALPPGMRSGFFESYKSEIAAYELDKLLGMNMVPPAVERRVDGDVGAAIMWLDGTTSVKQRGGKVPTGPAFGRPIRMMQLFDNLIGNIDRNAGNILIDGANNVILIDHSRAFTTKSELPFKFERVEADLWEKVKALTSDQLTASIGAWVEHDAIAAMLSRRDRIQAEVDKLVKKKGAAAVIVR